MASLRTGDTAICKQSWKIASLVTGGILNAVERVISGKFKNVFCITRPPGHHANSEKGMGFAYLIMWQLPHDMLKKFLVLGKY